MKILHISCTTRFGAGRSLWRHHHALRLLGVDSQILISDEAVHREEGIHYFSDIGPSHAVHQGNTDDYGESLDDRDHPNVTSYARSRLIPANPLFRESDVVELRQLHAGRQRSFFDPSVIREMTSIKPVIWRLSDLSAFTGFCCYPFDCVGWTGDCDNCPLAIRPERTEARVPRKTSPRDRLVFKRNLYSELNLTVVCPSRWILDMARRSVMGKVNGDFCHIPVGIDENVFHPRLREAARARWGLNEGPENVIIVNAPDPANFRKGFDLLLEVIRNLKDREFRLMIIGDKIPPELPETIPHWTKTGYLVDELDLAFAYAAGDIFLFPSRQDNSAQVLLEASSSGIPSVCFDVGGNSEYIEDGVSGRVIPAYDTNLFAEAVVEFLDDSNKRKRYGAEARMRVRRDFTQSLQTKRFLNLYQSLSCQ
jgi:glycosyltransferase involved in cell wall biosynthesis